MRVSITATALYAGLAIAASAPDGFAQQESLNPDRDSAENDFFGFSQVNSWKEHFVSVDAIKSAFSDAVAAAESVVDTTIGTLKEAQDKAAQHLEELHQAAEDGHKKREQTVYQILSDLPHTKKFAKLVGKFPDLVDLINGTDNDYTIFAPHDDAFKNIPDNHDKPDKEVLKHILQYHIANGNFGAKKVVSSYTLPSILDEKLLGDEKQRLRTSWNLAGVKVNFYSKIIAADIKGKNGVVHIVNHILVPPPFVGVILTLFPSEFSTLLLAYEKTDFVKFVHGQKMAGSTVFAPSNKAFQALGPRANAFLFNTKQGHKYLSAILKYGIIPNATVYSDAFYDKRTTEEVVDETLPQEHYDLATLLPKAHVGIDIGHFLGFKFIKVNGFTDVALHDAISRNGVIHVVNQVILPPHKSKGPKTTADISVEELKERLSDYVEDDDVYWSEL